MWDGEVRGEVWCLSDSIPYTLLPFQSSVQYCTLACAARAAGLHGLFANSQLGGMARSALAAGDANPHGRSRGRIGPFRRRGDSFLVTIRDQIVDDSEFCG